MSSLEALQHAALGQEESAASGWLAGFGLDKARRLGESLQVDAGWESAVETVLAGLLDGVLVDDPLALANEFDALGEADLALLAAARGRAGRRRHAGGQGARSGRGDAAARPGADGRIAGRGTPAGVASRCAARSRSSPAAANGWRRVGAHPPRAGQPGRRAGARARDPHAGRADRHAGGAARGSQRPARRPAHRASSKPSAPAMTPSASCTTRIVASPSWPASCRAIAASWKPPAPAPRRSPASCPTLAEQLDELQGQTREARARLDESVDLMGDLEDQRRELENERRALLEAREEARMNAREAADQSHSLALSMESKRSSLASLEQALARHGRADPPDRGAPQRNRRAARLRRRSDRRTGSRAPDLPRPAPAGRPAAGRGAPRAGRLRHRVPQAGAAAPSGRAGPGRAAREAVARNVWPRRRLQLRAAAAGRGDHRLRARAGDRCWPNWPKTSTPTSGAASSPTSAQKIVRLEPVNLAAIQEHAEQSERKTYLDNQLTDLVSAMETLEGRDQEDRPRDAPALQGNLRQGQRRRAGAVPAPVRRRPCLSGTDRRRPAQYRRGDHGAPARQARRPTSRCSPAARRR